MICKVICTQDGITPQGLRQILKWLIYDRWWVRKSCAVRTKTFGTGESFQHYKERLYWCTVFSTVFKNRRALLLLLLLLLLCKCPSYDGML